MVKSIFLQDGEEIFVDDEDYERVSQYTWYKYYKDGSAKNTRIIRADTSEGERLFLKNLIFGGTCWQKTKNNFFTKDNLTNCSHPNKWQKAQYNSSSKYKGVSWNKRTKKWKAQISVEGKSKNLGSYSNEDDAARVYNQAVLDYWDGNGYMNAIGEDNRLKQREYQNYKKRRRKSETHL